MNFQRIFLSLWVVVFLGLPPCPRPEAAPVSSRPADTASYSIDVTLDPDQKQLEGSETITYTNTGSAPISDLVFHLYLNAFSSTDTIFLRESGTQHRGFGFDPDSPGWIEVDSLRLAGGEELELELLEDGTLARSDLPAPIAPGESLQVEVSFRAQLPRVFARTGFAETESGSLFFMVGQWFPKLGVWQDDAWNAYPFHANAEFFADFGDYEVSITLPSEYVTGGSGLQVSREEVSRGTQTVVYRAEDVIDFAWTASPDFLQETRQVGEIELVYLYLPEHSWSVERALDAAEASLRYFGEWFGSYPYRRLTVVDVPDAGAGAGGMEYPTLITSTAGSMITGGRGGGAAGFDRSLEITIAHEAAHQWWQSVVATNEAEEPWLDEGFTDYSAVRLFEKALEGEAALDLAGMEISYLDLRRAEYLLSPQVPMYGKAWDFAFTEYAIATYSKPALSLTTLEGVLGEDVMLEVMSAYFSEHSFAHPTTEDFRRVAEDVSGQDLDWFFEGLVYGDGVVNYRVETLTAREVVLQREGDLEIPVDVTVTFVGGETVTEIWNGEQPEVTFSYPSMPEIASVEIDPEREVVIDLNWSDNSESRQPDFSAWGAVVIRLIYSLQNFLLSLGGL